MRVSIRSTAFAVLVTLLSALLLVPAASSASVSQSDERPGVASKPLPRLAMGSLVGGFFRPVSGSGGLSRGTVSARIPSGTSPEAAIRSALRAQGYRSTRPIKNVKVSRGYRSSIRANIRYNLSTKTGYTKIESDAHHVMPVKFEPQFRARGINIHEAKNLRWWYKYSHRSKAAAYNREWATYFRRNPTASKQQVLNKARAMDRKWSKYYEKPGPRGCETHGCRGRMAS
jgi:hypothetical protein